MIGASLVLPEAIWYSRRKEKIGIKYQAIKEVGKTAAPGSQSRAENEGMRGRR